MATYYRWRESEIGTGTETTSDIGNNLRINGSVIYLGYSYSLSRVTFKINSYQIIDCKNDTSYTPISYQKMYISSADPYPTVIYELTESTNTNLWGRQYLSSQGQVYITTKKGNVPIIKHTFQTAPGEFRKYVYSTSSSAYPNGGIQGAYYYDQRTTVTSPTAPTGLTYPNPITTPSAAISWTAATSATDYPVSLYEVSYSTNGGSSWTVAGTTAEVSYTFSITPGTTSIMFRVRAQDSNGQWGVYMTGTASQVLLAPTLTVPQMVMQGQQATISWSAIEGADSYTLQRKANTDADWTQVYSGANLSYSETVGTWTSVQYRVQAVFSGTPGVWATSAEIPVVSASALVISGQDGDLGTLVNDVPYSISTDTGNQITATITVNSAVIFSGNVGNSTSDVIPVLDLVNGEGTIMIEASVTASSGPVSAVRTWTYTKAPITFPNAGSVAQLTQQGANVWPKTLAECVRLPGGKNLDEVTAFPCQIYVGSYTGTGTYGASNPNELTCPFPPKVWGILTFPSAGGPQAPTTNLVPWGLTSAILHSTAIVCSYDGNTVDFYNATSAANQCNTSGATYYYIFLG